MSYWQWQCESQTIFKTRSCCKNNVLAVKAHSGMQVYESMIYIPRSTAANNRYLLPGGHIKWEFLKDATSSYILKHNILKSYCCCCWCDLQQWSSYFALEIQPNICLRGQLKTMQMWSLARGAILSDLQQWFACQINCKLEAICSLDY